MEKQNNLQKRKQFKVPKTKSANQIWEEKQKKEIEIFLKNYPTEELQADAVDYLKISKQMGQEYMKKHNNKKCLHENDSSKISTSKGDNYEETTYTCKHCGIVYASDLCSPFHDGDITYYDVEYGELEKSIMRLYQNNQKILDKIKNK